VRINEGVYGAGKRINVSLNINDVKNAKPASKDYKLTDGHGLSLQISSFGTKTWHYRYRHKGREKVLTLGRYPDMGLAAARLARDDAKRVVLSGKDPGWERKRQRQEDLRGAEATFRKLGDEWLDEHAPLWAESNAKRVRNRFERDVYPAFGNVPIAEIEATDVLRLLRKIEARGSIETAKRVRNYIRAVFARAKGEGLVPMTYLMELDELKSALKPPKRGRRQPALTTVPELLELQQCADKARSTLLIRLASRLLALTIVRTGVLRTASWTEFEGIDWADPDQECEKPIWRIPAERMKLEVEDKLAPGFGHDVPLSTQAVGVLRAVRVLSGSSKLLFPHAHSWAKPMTDAAISGMYKRMAGGKYKNRMVPHGWRSAFSTIMNERAAELERDGDRLLIEIILSHVPPGMTASEWAYNRARYLKPRAGLLQVWADMVSNGLSDPMTLVRHRAR
jgi:integrase